MFPLVLAILVFHPLAVNPAAPALGGAVEGANNPTPKPPENKMGGEVPATTASSSAPTTPASTTAPTTASTAAPSTPAAPGVSSTASSEGGIAARSGGGEGSGSSSAAPPTSGSDVESGLKFWPVIQGLFSRMVTKLRCGVIGFTYYMENKFYPLKEQPVLPHECILPEHLIS